jgi:hypothetical protein
LPEVIGSHGRICLDKEKQEERWACGSMRIMSHDDDGGDEEDDD